jgi:uncharacterized protein YkwD
MPPFTALRRALIAAAAGTTLALGAAPASAADLPSQRPCIAGVTCSATPTTHCANANLEPAGDNLAKVRRSTLCLLNVQRAKHGLGRLHSNTALRGVATRYAKKMVAQSFFDHVAPGGITFVQRIRASAYIDAGDGYSVGENLAWGSGVLATPRRIVRAWMASPGHRANILNGAYRDIGVGVTVGVPVAGGGSGATYVNEFGTRS